MKLIKLTDLSAQFLLITGFTILQLFKKDGTFIVGYLTVGCWQLISMAIHISQKWHPLKGGKRYNYHVFVGCLLLLAGLAALMGQSMYLLYFLLFASPVMAVYYVWICYREVFYYSKRPLELI